MIPASLLDSVGQVSPLSFCLLGIRYASYFKARAVLLDPVEHCLYSLQGERNCVDILVAWVTGTLTWREHGFLRHCWSGACCRRTSYHPRPSAISLLAANSNVNNVK
jgi:hypothetical protein